MEHRMIAPKGSSSSTPGEPDLTRRRFPKSSIKILKQWFLTNAYDPHPTETQRRFLCEQTGLSMRQVSNWFANARRRGVERSTHNVHTSAAQASAPISISSANQTRDWESMNPFERWRNSPPDQEAVSLAAVADAAAKQGYEAPTRDPLRRPGTPFMGSSTPRPLSETSFESMSSFWTSGSSSSAQSERSDVVPITSHRTSENLNSGSRRQRRRSISRYHVSARRTQKAAQLRMYQCTFCTDTFKTKFDWVRHEGTLHLVLEKWTCTPEGPTYLDQAEQVMRCAFCDKTEPDEAHLVVHNYRDCGAKLHKDRTFRRKDHLRQHLRLIHGTNTPPLTMGCWQTTLTNIESRCGFCGEHFTSWPSRMEHIGDHFQEGAKMKDWKGDRGLTSEVALLVENAMPPYMIGVEANTFVPFSATRNLQQSNTERDGRGLTERTMYQDFTTRLAECVLESLRNGILVTDESVRKQARLTMFGDDDAWNQTPADNDEWLRLFKHGLSSGSLQSTKRSQPKTLAGIGSTTPARPQDVPTDLWAELAELSWDPYSATQNMNDQLEVPELPPQVPDNIQFSSHAPLTWMFPLPERSAETRDTQNNNQSTSTLDIDSYLQMLAMDSTAVVDAIDRLPQQDLADAPQNFNNADFIPSHKSQTANDDMNDAFAVFGDQLTLPDDLDFHFDLGLADNSGSFGDEHLAASEKTK